jgi:hypothetical protein
MILRPQIKMGAKLSHSASQIKNFLQWQEKNIFAQKFGLLLKTT